MLVFKTCGKLNWYRKQIFMNGFGLIKYTYYNVFEANLQEDSHHKKVQKQASAGQ